MIIRRKTVFGDAIDDEIRANLLTGMFDAEIKANIAQGMDPVAAVSAATGRPALAGEWNLTPGQINAYYGYAAPVSYAQTQPPPFVPAPLPDDVPAPITPAPPQSTQMVNDGVVADLLAQYAHAASPPPASPMFSTEEKVAIGVGVAAVLGFLFLGKR